MAISRVLAEARRSLPYAFMNALVGAFACWTMMTWMCVFGGLSFNACAIMAPFCFAVGIGWSLWELGRQPRVDSYDMEQAPIPSRFDPLMHDTFWVMVMGGIAAIASEEYLWLYIPLLVHLAVMVVGTRHHPKAEPSLTPRTIDAVMITVTAILGVVATSWLNVPNLDDGYYLNEVLFTLERPDLPVLAFDGMFGIGAPLQRLAHRPQVWEIAVATLSRYTGIDPVDTFYLVVPVLVAIVAPIAQWLVLRELSVKHAAWALPLLCIVILSWGGFMSSIGNVGYVRFHHGKGIFVHVLTPVCIFYMLRYMRVPNRHRLLALTFATIATAGVTSTALVLLPAVLGVVALSTTPLTRDGVRTLLSTVASIAPLAFVLLLVQHEMSSSDHEGAATTAHTMWVPLGEFPKGASAIFIGASLPLLLRGGNWHHAKTVSRVMLGLAILLLNPWVGDAFELIGGPLARHFSWRLLWVVPLPPLVACASVAAFALAFSRTKWKKAPRFALAGVFVCGATMLFLFSGQWSHQQEDARIVFGQPRRPVVDAEVAEAVLPLVEENSFMLAPRRIARWTATYPGRPGMVFVRVAYGKNLTRYWGQRETDRRYEAMQFTVRPRRRSQIRATMKLMDELCVDIVVLKGRAARNRRTRKALKTLGFKRRKTVARHIIWKRPLEGCQPPVYGAQAPEEERTQTALSERT